MFLYKLLTVLFRIWLLFYFKTIQVIGLQNIPRQEGLLMFGNHPNALCDPAAVFTSMPRMARTLFKNTLLRVPVLGFVIKSLGGIGVKRRQDHQAKTTKKQKNQEQSKALISDTNQKENTQIDNSRMWEETNKTLLKGQVICIYPEGISVVHHELNRYKSGVSRILINAIASTEEEKKNKNEEKNNIEEVEDEEEIVDLEIQSRQMFTEEELSTDPDLIVKNSFQRIQLLPFSLNYTSRKTFRSEILITYSRPICLHNSVILMAKEDKWKAVNLITSFLQKCTRLMTINTPDWETHSLVETSMNIFWRVDRTSLKRNFENGIRLANFFDILSNNQISNKIETNQNNNKKKKRNEKKSEKKNEKNKKKKKENLNKTSGSDLDSDSNTDDKSNEIQKEKIIENSSQIELELRSSIQNYQKQLDDLKIRDQDLCQIQYFANPLRIIGKYLLYLITVLSLLPPSLIGLIVNCPIAISIVRITQKAKNKPENIATLRLIGGSFLALIVFIIYTSVLGKLFGAIPALIYFFGALFFAQVTSFMLDVLKNYWKRLKGLIRVTIHKSKSKEIFQTRKSIKNKIRSLMKEIDQKRENNYFISFYENDQNSYHSDNFDIWNLLEVQNLPQSPNQIILTADMLLENTLKGDEKAKVDLKEPEKEKENVMDEKNNIKLNSSSGSGSDSGSGSSSGSGSGSDSNSD
ncbi:glycerol-3-phosphate o-acyltransferase [Anaeramoeba flamelloides]|uniref:Glycerol-3-phosphate o-acyltransferase n=1 Tax=Anaeramoeba flamelloides TaxID=1746091 RepID=A0AAV8A270_9EUKA|nr:glycerol-3-phosphate o-acyltransferase [Anaeramoeba flamelloides]